jgi:hypothetical protein
MAKYEFAIKKDTLNSGKVVYTPVCRMKALFGNKFFPRKWERITRIYNDYILMDLDFIPDLSYQECEEHIHAYQNKLLKQRENDIAEVEFHTLEEAEI